MALGVMGLLGFIFFLALLIVRAVKKQKKLLPVIGLGVCFIIFIVGIALQEEGPPELTEAEKIELQQKQSQFLEECRQRDNVTRVSFTEEWADIEIWVTPEFWSWLHRFGKMRSFAIDIATQYSEITDDYKLLSIRIHNAWAPAQQFETVVLACVNNQYQ